MCLHDCSHQSLDEVSRYNNGSSCKENLESSNEQSQTSACPLIYQVIVRGERIGREVPAKKTRSEYRYLAEDVHRVQ